MNNPARKLCPCKGCSDRRVDREYNCHSHCEAFREWQEALKAAKAKATISKAVKSAEIENNIRLSNMLKGVKKGRY